MNADACTGLTTDKTWEAFPLTFVVNRIQHFCSQFLTQSVTSRSTIYTPILIIKFIVDSKPHGELNTFISLNPF